MTCRDAILHTIRILIRDRPDGLFSPRDVMRIMRAQRSPYALATIEAHITSVMCVNAPPRPGRRFPDLERVSRGRYRLRPANRLEGQG
ncbi:hypothetical protein [Deinococcus yunweiensis]|uniref:DUF7669 domain-containing protein n=1 Tax=Deinococcus yunweiensis TaxID=367282 RepID=UPI00398EBFB9